MWSSIQIPGKPSILLVDATQNVQGFEFEFSDRLFHALKRSGIEMEGDSPLRIHSVETLAPHLQSYENNCILLCAHGSSELLPLDATLKQYWEWLNSHPVPHKLFAVCSWQIYDKAVTEEILKAKESFAKIALVPQSELTGREAGLFYLKFFTELSLHTEDHISGKMAWFSFSKAKELLRRRRYTGKFGARC